MSDMTPEICPARLAVLAARPGLPDDIRDALSDAAILLDAEHAARVEAEAATTLVVERAAGIADAAVVPVHPLGIEVPTSIAAAIRVLASDTGIKALAELRAERDALRLENGILRGNAKAQGLIDEIGAAGKTRRKTESRLARTISNQRAELRRLAARVAELEAREKALRNFVDDFAKAKIDALRYSRPHGASPEDEPDPVVDAETVWAWQADAKAALSQAVMPEGYVALVSENSATVLGPNGSWTVPLVPAALAAHERRATPPQDPPRAGKGDEG